MRIGKFLHLALFSCAVSTSISAGRVLFKGIRSSLRPIFSPFVRHLEFQPRKVSKPLATAFISVFLMIDVGIASSNAAIGEGDLPDGALAFQKVAKAQKEWKRFVETAEQRKNDIDDAEITRIKSYLKQLANEYYDMELLAKGIPDKEKSKKAVEIAKDFRVKIRECDDAASRSVQDAIVKITENFPSTYEELEIFFQLMSDVPDEL